MYGYFVYQRVKLNYILFWTCGKTCFNSVNPFQATLSLPNWKYWQYPLKTSENLCFLNFFRGYLKKPSGMKWVCKQFFLPPVSFLLTLSWRWSLSYRDQSIDLLCKSVVGFCMIETSVMKGLNYIFWSIVYVVVIARCRVQYGKYFPSFSYFATYFTSL